jgi:hypothetical protein
MKALSKPMLSECGSNLANLKTRLNRWNVKSGATRSSLQEVKGAITEWHKASAFLLFLRGVNFPPRGRSGVLWLLNEYRATRA